MTSTAMKRRPTPSFWLLVSTIVAVTAFVGASVYVWHRAGSIDELAQAIATNSDPSIRDLSGARGDLHEMGALVLSTFFDLRRLPRARDALELHRQRMHEAIDRYVELPFFPSERARWFKVALAVAAAETQLDAVMNKLESGDVTGAALIRDGQMTAALEQADVALGEQIELNADHSARIGVEIEHERRSAERMAFVLHGIATALTLAMIGISGVASRRFVRALRRAGEAEAALTKKLEAVAGAAVSIAENVRRSDLREVLQQIVDVARTVAGADLAALGVGTDPTRPFDPFVYSGIDPSFEDLYDAPRPAGVLGLVIERGSTLRLADAGKDPHFRGLPERHPRVGPFLGTVVRHESERIGHLYLARSPGARPFSEQDARAVELLAALAATAVQSAELYGALRREVSRREDLLSVVSHDLRNPLSAIILGARTLQRYLAPDAPGRRPADIIARNGGRMERMIADLLAAAKLQEGGILAIEPTAQETGPLVHEIVDAFAGAAADKGVSLRAEIDDHAPPAFCDPGRIGQVLSNLVGNAIKFTPPGGSILVRVRTGERHDEVCFSVRDTGVGIAQEALPHVFERFWQDVDQASRGTGLGLYIAKGIVDAHHGRIWVSSQLGEGSDFQFTVPAASWPETPSEEAGAHVLR